MKTRYLLVALLLVAARAQGDETTVNATPTAKIPAGSYVRCAGCDKGQKSTITLHAFRIDRDEVTIDQYNACVTAKRCEKPRLPKGEAKFGNHPVTHVTWQDAVDYCKFVGKRLPTEAEWERAAHGPGSPERGEAHYGKNACHDLVIGGYEGDKCPFKFDGPVDVAMADGKEPHRVYWDQTSPTSEDGTSIYDLYGNVAEWTADWDAFPGDPAYYFKPQFTTNPKGPDAGTKRVVAGGSFAATDGSRAGERRREDPKKGYRDVGFRCAAD